MSGPPSQPGTAVSPFVLRAAVSTTPGPHPVNNLALIMISIRCYALPGAVPDSSSAPGAARESPEWGEGRWSSGVLSAPSGRWRVTGRCGGWWGPTRCSSRQRPS